MGRKQWQIDKLHNKPEYSEAAGIVINNRLNQVKEDIKLYLSTETVESLHRVRISLRRLRYGMELFISCYDRKYFMILYKKITKLQDLSGKIRDFDVMEENMNSLVRDENLKIPKKVIRKVNDLRGEYKYELKKDLVRFVEGRGLKKL